MTALLVPFRFGDDRQRDQAWRYVRGYYTREHRGMRIVVGECREGEPWSKGRALTRAFQRSDEDVLVLADADVLVDPGHLAASIAAVRKGASWSMPHGRVYRLSAVQSRHAMQTPAPRIKDLPADKLERRMHRAPAGGGIVVLTRDAYETVRGIDPRFVGWGGDDISFARALDTLVGPGEHGDAAMWHLWHERAPRRWHNRASDASETLAARYLDASGNVAAMRELVDEIDW